jgi:DNA-binding XRE family transcriptional regulator
MATIERPTTERGRRGKDISIVRGMQDPNLVRKQLGRLVRELRDKRNWSQEELAHRSGLARSFTGAIERGEKDVRVSTLVKLSNTFAIPISALFK